MAFWNELRSWSRAMFRRSRMESEMDVELRFHMEAFAEDLIRRGIPSNEALRRARLEFGGLERVKEEGREARGVHFLDEIATDLRHGLRVLHKSPGFATVAVLTLALGIGANTAIFSVVDAVLLRPLPFPHADRLVQLWETESSPGNFPLIGEDYLEWLAQNRTFDDMAVLSYPESFNVSSAGQPERATVVETQANFFSLLGVKPLLGRPFVTGEDQNGQNRVALLSYGYWRRHFGGQASAVGQPVQLNGVQYTVVGVTPQWYRLQAAADLWIPLDVSAKGLGGRQSHHLEAIGRMKAGVSVEQAQADLRRIALQLEKQFPDTNTKVSAVVVPLKEEIVGGTRSELWVMFAAVALVLLIACINVANLLLVRSQGRRTEIAMRAALGASLGRLVRQLLAESVLLSLCGAIPGVALAYACVTAATDAKTFPIPQPNPVGVNSAVLLCTLAVSIVIGLLFGMLPAFQTSRLMLTENLKAGRRNALASSARGRFLRDALVAAEVALSLTILASAGLLLRTFAGLRNVDIGVRPQKVLTAMIQLPAERYTSPESKVLFLERLLQSLRTTPGVQDVAVSDALPLTPGTTEYMQIEGLDDPSLKQQLIQNNSVTPDYFRVLGIPMLKGKPFSQADIDVTANQFSELVKLLKQNSSAQPKVQIAIPVVINQAMADRFWPNQEVTDKTVRANGTALRIVGIAANTHEWNLRTVPLPEVYWPLSIILQYGEEPLPLSISLLSAGAPERFSTSLLATVRSQDSSLAVFNVRPIPQIVSDSMTETQYQTVLLGALAALALVLAVVGTYGVMSYRVTQRTHEIGIRMAIGAGRGGVLWMIMRQGFSVTAAGIVLGIGGTLVLSKSLEDLLYGVKPEDPLTLAAVCAVMMIAALLACWIPARRASQLDPLVALRYE